jgi:hypothetical protein
MISFTEITDRFVVEGVARQDKTGLLMTPWHSPQRWKYCTTLNRAAVTIAQMPIATK